MDSKQNKEMEMKQNVWVRRKARWNAWKAERNAVMAIAEAFRL